MALQVKRKANISSDCSSSSFLRRRRTDVDSSCDDILSADILSSILRKLNYIDIVHSGIVSCYWKSIVEGLQISPLPCLLLPSEEDVCRGDHNSNAYSCFLKLGESQVYSFKRIPEEFRESCCVGSSNGWLVFLDDGAVPFLFQPFKQAKIKLPSLLDLDVLGLEILERNPEGDNHTKQQVRNYTIRKVVLIGEPDHDNENFGVVLLCKYKQSSSYSLVYYRSGDGLLIRTSIGTRVVDMIWHENHIYTLKDGGTDMDIWGLEDNTNCLVKKKKFIFQFPGNIENFQRDLCSARFYLIESCGTIMLAVRVIGDYVDSYGTPIDIENVSDDIDIFQHPKIYPYQTCLFHVYKLDIHRHEWVEIESLDDHVLFLGGNQSVCLSINCCLSCEKNSIYYTDDNWERIDEDYLYGGHDMGIYNMKEMHIKPIYEFSSNKVFPPPCLIVPNHKP